MLSMTDSTLREIGHESKAVKMNLLQAINSGLDIAMASDQRVVCFGEDVAEFGGVFRATSNLQKNMIRRAVLTHRSLSKGLRDLPLAWQLRGPLPSLRFSLPIIYFLPLIKL